MKTKTLSPTSYQPLSIEDLNNINGGGAVWELVKSLVKKSPWVAVGAIVYETFDNFDQTKASFNKGFEAGYGK